MTEERDSGSLSFSGWVPLLSRQWAVAAEQGRCLTGTLGLSAFIELTAGRSRRVRCVTVQICPAASPEIDEDVPFRLAVFLGSRNLGARIFVSAERPDEPVSAELTVHVAAEEFEALWERAQSPHALWVRGEIPGVGYGGPIEVPDKWVDHRVVALHLQATSGSPAAADWVPERLGKDFIDALADTHLGGGWTNQVGQVASELARSSPLSGARPSSGCSPVEEIRELVAGVRAAFRTPLVLNPERGTNLYNLSPSQFTEAVASQGPEKAKKLLAEYDTLWEHFRVTSVVAAGEAKSGATPKGFQPDVEELESVAGRLLGNTDIHSATLEWALLDALIYAECIAFAQHIVSGQTVIGMTVPGELKGIAQPKFAFKELVSSAGRVALEGVKVVATFAIASGLAMDNVQTAWVITTGVTAARWIRLAILSESGTSTQTARLLLAEMANLHELLKSRQFNPRALRQELYRVSAKGALFSPWVFNILDARIRREG